MIRRFKSAKAICTMSLICTASQPASQPVCLADGQTSSPPDGDGSRTAASVKGPLGSAPKDTGSTEFMALGTRIFLQAVSRATLWWQHPTDTASCHGSTHNSSHTHTHATLYLILLYTTCYPPPSYDRFLKTVNWASVIPMTTSDEADSWSRVNRLTSYTDCILKHLAEEVWFYTSENSLFLGWCLISDLWRRIWLLWCTFNLPCSLPSVCREAEYVEQKRCSPSRWEDVSTWITTRLNLMENTVSEGPL